MFRHYFFLYSYIFRKEGDYLKSVIPFTKELEFDTKVSEITSISLEREFEILDGSIEGHLFITGEYKSHEVSVNIIPFSFKIPFSIALSSETNKDSISLEISDFAYDTLDDNKIKVHIELELAFEQLEENEENEERNVEVHTDEILEMMEEQNMLDMPFEQENVSDEDIQIISNEEEIKGSVENEIMPIETEEVPKENEVMPIAEEAPLAKEIIKEETMVEEATSKEEVVIESNTSEEYMTYHIHILQEGESLETLCNMYHTTGGFLAEYNDISSLNVGDKILIPIENE